LEECSLIVIVNGRLERVGTLAGAVEFEKDENAI
jgi:hypothetical protein